MERVNPLPHVRGTFQGCSRCEGWKHFREGRGAIERELAQAPEDVRARFRWLPIGEPVTMPG